MPRQLSIQAFPTPLRIASLIRCPDKSGSSQLHPLAHNLLARLITFAPLHSPEFFGLVSNDAETAVYAAADMVQKAVDDLCATQQEQDKWIEVAEESWKAFQIDGEGTGGQKGEDAGEQQSIIHTVTAVLAEAGISCKYQSSYYADFVLVKTQCFAETMELFQNCGWSVEDPSDHTPTSPSSAQVSLRSRSPQTPRGHPSRQSTSSLPEASNEYITYYDSPVVPDTVPRRRTRPHTADGCLGNNQQARRGGGLRSLADGGVKRRSMSTMLDLQKDERLERDRKEESRVSKEQTRLQNFRVEVDQRRDREDFQFSDIKYERDDEGDRLSANEVVPSWAEALVEQLDDLLLDQKSNSIIAGAEERRSSTPASVTIDMSGTANGTSALMYPVLPSCPIRSGSQHRPTEATRSTAPVVSQLQGRIAVVGLNKETESQWEHRVQVFLIYPEAQVKVCKNQRSVGRSHCEGTTPRSLEANASDGRTQEETVMPKKQILQVSSESGSSAMTNGTFISYIRTREGTSLATEIPIIRSLFPNEAERDSLLQSGGELDMFDDEDIQNVKAGNHEPHIFSTEGHVLHSANHDPGDEINGVATASSPGRFKLDMSDSGYGSEFGIPGMDVHQVPSSDLRLSRSSSPERIEGWKPERGVKYCLQLYCQQPGVCKGDQDEGSVHTHLIADISQSFSTENGLNMLYASTYHSANILVESQHVRVASRILGTVVGGFGKEAKV
ncbi:hypothetical protein QFC22_004624 [Naganishia vaughanmartiniae]|uniref:Uncharacterized protein n=1 Tax=Naganishia vaughanmartiniae TaxID=1424756 RepID=A0ACC2X1M9_9TREE|nr:hypothetical protein QFC22_004624 [Naganishia vaughanmartiniae]